MAQEIIIFQVNEQNTENLDLTTKYIMENIDKTLIIFCNTISGNQEGKSILGLANNYLTKEKYKLIDFQYLIAEQKNEPIKSVFFDLLNKEDNDKGQLLLKHCVEKCKLNQRNGLSLNFQAIKVLIGGGDGSVFSTIESFIKNGIDVNYCIFGHLPLGTGNDLSNSLGFSDSIDKFDFNELYKILYRYYSANADKIDIWKLDLELDPIDGEILVNKKDGKIPLKDDNGNILKKYVKTFINYASLGYDARVGYDFDHKRSDSRNINKIIYVYEGLKKICCRKTISVQKFIESLTVYDSLENSINQESFFSDESQENNNNDNGETNATNNMINLTENNLKLPEAHKIKFRMTSSRIYESNQEKNNKKCLVLEGNPCSIIFQNINNYMSGVRDMWAKSEENITVGLKNGNEPETKKYTKKLKRMASCTQKYNDKMLEVFTFQNGFETGLEKLIRGLAKKIYHGRGPIEVKFFDTPKYIKTDKKHRIYMNVDGEYFHIVRPKLLRIELNRDICDGQISFLVNKNKSKS